jgi:glycosyltransferase involved in cell wall biosynthesis
MNRADLLLADTEAHRLFYVNEYGIDPSKIGTLYIGYDDSIFDRCAEPERKSVLDILFYGSFLPLHGIDTIIEAAALLSGRNYRFTIIGEGQTLGSVQIKMRNVSVENIIMKGKVSLFELPSIIGKADIVLGIFGTTPKTGMVIPNKVYQALASGRPVITADTPAIREIFEYGKHILTVPAGDPEALAGALRRLEGDADLASRLARQGGELVRTQYNPARVVERLDTLLQEKGIW